LVYVFWQSSKTKRSKFALWLCAPVLIFATAPAATAAHADDPAMDKAAALISDAIVHAKLKSVIVFDFSGPDYDITALGRALADDFNASLEKSAATFTVESRSQISTAIADNQFVLVSEDDGESMLAFARALKIDAFVMAHMSIEQNQLTVILSSYRARDGKVLKAVRITSPLTLEETELDATDLTARAFDGYPRPGKNGYVPPKCISRPRANYTPEAMANKIQGVVELEVIVRADGKVGEIRIVRPLPDGLTQSAISTVRKWTLKPAEGPDGKPAAVLEIIEVQFRLA
jgi:TonB family protein